MAERQFLNSKEDISWLKETHLDIPFKSFILVGNEDAPDEIILFESADPDYDEAPAAKILLNLEPEDGIDEDEEGEDDE